MTTTTSTGHRLNVIFADSTYAVLEELASKKGKSKAEILRDVISLSKYLEDIRTEGGKILVETKSGSIREIIPL